MTIPFIGIDWGTTNRRAYLLGPDGWLLKSYSDDQGLLAAQGRFPEALRQVLDAWSVGQARVLLSGMVGSRSGWREAPYLDTSIPVTELPRHLVRVDGAPDGLDCRIVPGYKAQDAGGPDVMRGEEAQILGALELGAGDGWFVLPGTHSKWVRVESGLIRHLRTYMTGELFATLSRQGTLAGLMSETADAPSAFAAGVDAAGGGALSHTLFGCRARVVTDAMPASEARSYLSGLLIGAEWHDIRALGAEAIRRVSIIGSRFLAGEYARVGAALGIECTAWEPDPVYLAALRRFMNAWQ